MIERKKKICKGCGHQRYIYAKGLCGYCYADHNRLKNNALTKGKVANQRKPTGEAALFEEIWDKRTPHISAVSNIPISTFEYRHKICFAHVLSKKQFPNFRLREDNIEFLKHDEHTFWDNRTDEELALRMARGEDWGYMLRREQELIEEYKSLYPGSFSSMK